MQRLVARCRRGGGITPGVAQRLVREQVALQVMLDAVPGALIARFFLAPDDLGGVPVLVDLRLVSLVRKRIELRNPDQRNVGNTPLAPLRAQVVEDLAEHQFN